jgi:hypothetical protein
VYILKKRKKIKKEKEKEVKVGEEGLSKLQPKSRSLRFILFYFYLLPCYEEL